MAWRERFQDDIERSSGEVHSDHFSILALMSGPTCQTSGVGGVHAIMHTGHLFVFTLLLLVGPMDGQGGFGGVAPRPATRSHGSGFPAAPSTGFLLTGCS